VRPYDRALNPVQFPSTLGLFPPRNGLVFPEVAVSVKYQDDIVVWANEQARLIRAGRFDLLDLEHIAEEIEDVGKSEQRELSRRMAVLLAHLLNVAVSAGAARGSVGSGDPGAAEGGGAAVGKDAEFEAGVAGCGVVGGGLGGCGESGVE